MKELGINLAEEVAKESVKREKRWYKKASLFNTIIIAVAILLVALIACGTILTYHAISEQQYAINAQYAEMADIARGTTVVEASDGGVAASDNTIGGDIVGGKDNKAQPEKGSE